MDLTEADNIKKKAGKNTQNYTKEIIYCTPVQNKNLKKRGGGSSDTQALFISHSWVNMEALCFSSNSQEQALRIYLQI